MVCGSRPATRTYARRRKTRMSPRRKFSRNEKIFYILSLLIVFSMVLSLIYVAITPSGF
jgi:cell division protein FtsL